MQHNITIALSAYWVQMSMQYSNEQLNLQSTNLHVVIVKMLVCFCICTLYVRKATMHCAQDKFPHGDNKV